MTDYYKLKDVFEMAEVLTYEDESTLEIDTVDEKNGNTATVVFGFNESKELIKVYVEE